MSQGEAEGPRGRAHRLVDRAGGELLTRGVPRQRVHLLLVAEVLLGLTAAWPIDRHHAAHSASLATTRARGVRTCEHLGLPAYQRSTIVHTPLWSSFSSGVESRHLFCLLAGIALQDDVFYPSLSPIFLLAQILMRTDLGDEPDSPPPFLIRDQIRLLGFTRFPGPHTARFRIFEH